MTKPVRLRLSRRKGFNLQALSRATNGLDAVNVARPGAWGNPFSITTKMNPDIIITGRYFAVPTVEDAIECFRIRLVEMADEFPPIEELRGKNLACWCPLGDNVHCHANVLLEIANS